LKVVIVSDVHLGYENSDKSSFNSFLDGLREDAEATDFVLLGDIVDMWRRDASGVFLENQDVMKKITALNKKMNVHYVAGNHDYHVLKLQNHSYPFKFEKNLNLLDGELNYRFLHGYEFDPAQQEPFMEALCRVMSDEAGSIESEAWASLTREWSDAKKFFYALLLRRRSFRKTASNLLLNPENRLKDTYGEVEKRACSYVQRGEILVFGHTHRPFINKEEKVVNTGSWVTDAPIHNTFVELLKGKPRLFVFGGEEIKERVEC
jgi:UDP-2,3-diacylglucosamine pyrophosphatase LpxH